MGKNGELKSNPSHTGKNSELSTTITIFKSMVGLGIMTTPIFFAEGGWVLSSILTAVVAVLIGYNITLLAEVVDHIEQNHEDVDLNQMEDCIPYVISSPKWQKGLFWGSLTSLPSLCVSVQLFHHHRQHSQPRQIPSCQNRHFD